MSRLKRPSSPTSSGKGSKKREGNNPGEETVGSTKQSVEDKWTLEELDLNEEIVSLYSLLQDKQLLVEKLFSILSSCEIKQMTPKALKDIPLSILKDICIIQLKDNAILSDEELMTALIDAERVFNTKYKSAPVKAVEEETNNDTVLDELIKKGKKFGDKTDAVSVEGKSKQEQKEETKEDKKEEEKKEELETIDLSLPSDFHNKMKESLVQKGLCRFEDLDLDQPLVSLESLIDDREKLWQLIQTLVLTDELLDMLPQILKGKSLDHVQSGIHEVICDLPKEVIEAVLNESNSSLNQESRGLNLIKSDSSTKGVKSNNEEVNEKGESRKEEKKELDEEMIEDGSKQTEEKEGRKKEQNPCNHEDLVSKKKIEEEKKGKERNPSGGDETHDDETVEKRKSRLSPDEELAQLEKKAQAIREMLKAVEEEEARLRVQKRKESEEQDVEATESDVHESDSNKDDVQGDDAQQPDELIAQSSSLDDEVSQEKDNSQLEKRDVPDTDTEVSHASDGVLKNVTEIDSELVISRVADDDEDSIDRELKGLD